MKMLKILSYLFAAIGVLLLIIAFIGRFILVSAVFGISARALMIGGDTFLLLAILAFLYRKE